MVFFLISLREGGLLPPFPFLVFFLKLPNFCCKRSSEGKKEYQTPEQSSPPFFLEKTLFPVRFFFAQSSGKYISGQINGRIPNTSYGVYIFLHSAFHQAKPKNLLAIRRGRRNALQQKRRKSLSFLSPIFDVVQFFFPIGRFEASIQLSSLFQFSFLLPRLNVTKERRRGFSCLYFLFCFRSPRNLLFSQHFLIGMIRFDFKTFVTQNCFPHKLLNCFFFYLATVPLRNRAQGWPDLLVSGAGHLQGQAGQGRVS